MVSCYSINFGINSESNLGRKIVIARGTAEHSYYFPAYIMRTINSKYYFTEKSNFKK